MRTYTATTTASSPTKSAYHYDLGSLQAQNIENAFSVAEAIARARGLGPYWVTVTTAGGVTYNNMLGRIHRKPRYGE